MSGVFACLAVDAISAEDERDLWETEFEKSLVDFNFEANCAALSDAFPLDWCGSLAANPRIQEFEHAACALTIFHSVLDQSLVGT